MPRRLRIKFPPKNALVAGRGTFTMNGNSAILVPGGSGPPPGPPPTGPFALWVEQHQLPGPPQAYSPFTYTVGNYGGWGGQGFKHGAFGKINGRWYKTGGDHAKIDPQHIATASQLDDQQDGRQEIFSFTLGDDNSWRVETNYWIPVAQSAKQFWNPDDSFGAVRGNEQFMWRSIGVLTAITPGDQPGASYAVQVDRSCAFSPNGGPGLGTYRDLGVDWTTTPEFRSNRAWHAIYDQARDVFLIPCNDRKILVHDGLTFQDKSVRTSGQMWDIPIAGSAGGGQWGLFGGFIKNNVLYLVDWVNKDLVTVDLSTFYGWTFGSSSSSFAMDETQVTPIYWNEAQGIQWVNNNWQAFNGVGDWKDVNGVLRGEAEWANWPSTGFFNDYPNGPGVNVTANITNIVNEWRANGNRGVLLRGGQRTVASRNNSNPAFRPYVTVVHSDGNTYTCTCTGDSDLDGGAGTTHLGTRDFIHLTSGENEVCKGIFQFDISGVPSGGSIVSAALHLTILQGESNTLGRVFLLWPPISGGGGVTPGGPPPAGMAVKVSSLPLTDSYSMQANATMYLDIANDVIVITGGVIISRPRTGDPNVWQTWPRIDGWVIDDLSRLSDGFAATYARRKMPLKNYYDPTYGGALSIGVADFDTSKSDERFWVIKIAPLPAWIPAAGQVGTISLNTVGSQNPITAGIGAPAFIYGGTGHDQSNVIKAWNSGGFAQNFGPLGAYFVCGGGDADWWGNEVYVFPLADTVTSQGTYPARTWKRINAPSSAMNGTDAATDPQCNLTWGEHGDGTPCIPHTYDQLEYLPPYSDNQAGQFGSLILCTKMVAYKQQHFRSAHKCNLDTGVWSRASTTPAIMPGVDEPSWCWHPRLRQMIGLEGGSGESIVNSMHTLDFNRANGAGTYGVMAFPSHTVGADPCMRYMSKRDVLVVASRRSTPSAHIEIAVYDPRTKASPFIPQLVGATIPAQWAPLSGNTPALEYVPQLGLNGTFFIRLPSPGEEQNLYKIDVPLDWLVSPWVVTKIVMPGVTVVGNTENGMWKRFSFAAPINCLVWVSSTGGPVYAYNVGAAG